MGTVLANTLLAVLLAVLSSGAVAGADGPTSSGASVPAQTPTRADDVAPAQTPTRADDAAVPAQTPPAAAPADCLSRAIDALQTRYENVRDVQANFVQTTRAAHTGGIAPEPVRSSGTMVVQKPARMRWVYEEPEPSLVVSDGESLWIYDPGFGEAQRLLVGEGFLSGAAVNFLLGEGDLRRDFEITLVSCEDAQAVLELTPRTPASYESLRVTADPRSGMLTRTRITDLLGNVTDVELSQLETNRSPDPETFRFVAPEGVSVVELDPVEVSHP